MKYFTLVSQFNDPHPITIDETELVKAIYGQLTGNPVVFKTASVSGSMIKNSKIVPDFSKVEKVYNPSGEDYLPKGVVQEHNLAIENAGEVVKAKMENRPPQLKEASATRIHTQGMKSLGDLLPKNDQLIES